MWKTKQTGRWDSLKGVGDRLIEVKIMVIRGNKFGIWRWTA